MMESSSMHRYTAATLIACLACAACGGDDDSDPKGASGGGAGGSGGGAAGSSAGAKAGGSGSVAGSSSGSGSGGAAAGSGGGGSTITEPFVATRLASGSAQNCVITKEQGLYCWGFGPTGGGAKYTQVSHQTEHHCAVDTTGKIDCFESSPLQSAIPTGTFTEVRVAIHGACAKDMQSKLTCWTDGNATSGALVSDVPTEAVKTFYVANDTGCAVLMSGTTQCWGFTSETTKRTMPPRSDFVVVSGGVALFGITPDGAIVGWGIGISTPDTPAGNDYVQIVDGEAHSAGLHADGTVTVVGPDAMPAPAGVKFVELSAGDGQTCGIDTTGAVHCWGSGTDAWFKSPPDTVRAF
jgi:hypothetical protein